MGDIPRLSVSPVAILRKIRRMILPDRVLGSPSAQWITSGVAMAPISLRTHSFTSLCSSRLGSSPGDQGDIGVDALSLISWGTPTTAASAIFGWATRADSDFGGAHAVAGDVEYIIHPAGDPVVAVLVATGTVAGEIATREGGEVGLLEALVIAEHGTHLAGPGVGDHQVALGGALQRLTQVVHQSRLYSEEGTGGRAGLERGDAGQRVMRMPPVSVCHQVSTMGQRSSPMVR